MKSLLDAVLVDFGSALSGQTGIDSLAIDDETTMLASLVGDLDSMRSHVQVGAIANSATIDGERLRNLFEPIGGAWLDVFPTTIDDETDIDDAKPLLRVLDLLELGDPSRVLCIGADAGSIAAAAAAAGIHYADLVTEAGSGALALRDVVLAWIDKTAGHRFEVARGSITPSDADAAIAATAFHTRLATPAGSLGRIEQLGIKLAAIAGVCPPPVPEPATIAIFAGDHGIVEWGVSPLALGATADMVSNTVLGGAAVNVLARHAGADVVVVDVGMAESPPSISLNRSPLLERNVRAGTNNLAIGPAMSRTEALLALDVGVEVAERAIERGARCLITGDIGAGSTTSAAAIIATITNRPASEMTGRGSGADDEMLARKIDVVDAVTDQIASASGPLTLLEQAGGLEIAAAAGFIVGGAAARVPVIVDGVIANAALLVAAQLAPDVVDYVVPGHRSAEPAAAAALEFVNLEPLLDLELSLGEGAGGALALPVVQAAAKLLREMATSPQ